LPYYPLARGNVLLAEFAGGRYKSVLRRRAAVELHPLPADRAAVRRYVEELWLPYNRDLEAAVDRHALATDVDLVAEEVEFRLDRLESAGYRAWVAVDRPTDTSGRDLDIATSDDDLVGFVTTDVDEAPTVFDRPDRLVVGDIYVGEPYRGTGLARRLIDRAAERAREAGCSEVVLDVDVDNERAIGFYEGVGFETYRYRMSVAVDEL
ncbi:MAG: GNAT family N-acetyltransferase, partial [Haloarculaceae archaeon]